MILFPPAKGAILSAWLAAEAGAVLQSHREWVTAGRPGAVSHEEAMAELLGGSQ